MNADLTFNSVAFKKSFDEKGGSERRSVTRGVNIPDVMSIKRQDATQSSSKLAMKRYLIRFDRAAIDAVTGVNYNTSAYAVIEIPTSSTSTDISTIVATFKAAVADADLITNVLNSES
jgi:hypothetical protein